MMKKNNKLNTAIQFTKNILTTGAIAETSREVEVEITKKIPSEGAKIIVEFGMGHGNITKEILEQMSPDSKLYSFEVKKEFCEHVKNEIKDERLIIVNDGAENISKHVDGKVDAIVSSIPFTFFSKEKSELILGDTYKALAKDHFFSQILYSKIHTKKLENFFDKCTIVKTSNFPAGFVYHCEKHEE